MGKLTLLLLALLVWLQYSLGFGKNGLHDYGRVSEDVQTIFAEPQRVLQPDQQSQQQQR